MKCYLLGGPETDIFVMYSHAAPGMLGFPHMKPMALSPDLGDSPPVDVENHTFRKVYEHHGRREPFAVYVFVEKT